MASDSKSHAKALATTGDSQCHNPEGRMDRFLERTVPRPTQAPQRESDKEADITAKMAAALSAVNTIAPPASSPVLQSPEDTEVAHAKITLVVVQILTPMITEVVDKAVQHSMEQLWQELHSQTHRLQEAQQQIASSSHMGVPQFLIDRLKDLENRSYRNNIRNSRSP